MKRGLVIRGRESKSAGYGRNNVFRRRHFYRATPSTPTNLVRPLQPLKLLLFPMLYVNCTVKSHYIRVQCVHYILCQKHFLPPDFPLPLPPRVLFIFFCFFSASFSYFFFSYSCFCFILLAMPSFIRSFSRSFSFSRSSSAQVSVTVSVRCSKAETFPKFIRSCDASRSNLFHRSTTRPMRNSDGR